MRIEAQASFQADAFVLVGAEGETTSNAFVSFVSDVPVRALATVIDNRTNDTTAVLAVAAEPPATLVRVGDEAAFAGSYGVSGRATVADRTTVRVSDFKASGTAPGMNVRVGHSNAARKDFTVLRVLGRQSFGGATFDLPLPPSVDLNAFDKFTVWCYEFNVIIAEGRFTRP